jgi:hypothetical protein
VQLYVSDGDDAAALRAEGIATISISAVSQMFEDAAIQNVAMCIASPARGMPKLFNGKAPSPVPR